jgi:hypothetical protein
MNRVKIFFLIQDLYADNGLNGHTHQSYQQAITVDNNRPQAITEPWANMNDVHIF